MSENYHCASLSCEVVVNETLILCFKVWPRCSDCFYIMIVRQAISGPPRDSGATG